MFTPTTTILNSSASGTARQLFYWISMLVVTLIAAITVMEAFGFYFFPHRSWSEGINPKVIQIRGGALYYKYIAVKHFGPSARASGWSAADLYGGCGRHKTNRCTWEAFSPPDDAAGGPVLSRFGLARAKHGAFGLGWAVRRGHSLHS